MATEDSLVPGEKEEPFLRSLKFDMGITAVLAAGLLTSCSAPLAPSKPPFGDMADLIVQRPDAPFLGFDAVIETNHERLQEEGRTIFRSDTFGSEAFWGEKMRLHEALAGAAQGGVGPGISPKAALGLGLKVDVDALPQATVQALQAGKVDLDSPKTTLALLQANAVVGVKGVFEGNKLKGVGITCALCHSTVDDSLTAGVGRRLDGWPNRDLNVGAIVLATPNHEPLLTMLGIDEATLTKALSAWGPGRYDAELLLDGKAFRPDGKTAATVMPAAFGLAGVNQHTYTGFGSVPYWNSYVAVTQMHGQGNFYDPRLSDATKYPISAKNRLWDTRSTPDLVTPKLPALHAYQLSIPAPTPPAGSFDAAMAKRGQGLFEGKARCSTCHMGPTFTDAGWNMHTAEEIGIDDFQARRSPDNAYRTTPLKGLFTRAKGGFYHDGRFPDREAVVDHYDGHLKLQLTGQEKQDLVQYLKSL
jgi:hypothetical protein